MAAVRLFGVLSKVTASNIKVFRIRGNNGVSTHIRSFSAAVPQTHTKSKIVDNVYVITLDSPNSKVNSLSQDVMNELQSELNKAKDNPNVTSAVLITGKPGCFIAGADINMLAACKTFEEVKKISEEGQRILGEVEKMNKPVVAAIMGSCLGGGLESWQRNTITNLLAIVQRVSI